MKKRKGFVLVGSFNQIIFVLYLTTKCKSKLKALGPANKMSCIGKYRRNVIDFRETAAMSLLLSFLGILDVVLTLVYIELNLDPRAVFYIDSFVWIFLVPGDLLSPSAPCSFLGSGSVVRS